MCLAATWILAGCQPAAPEAKSPDAVPEFRVTEEMASEHNRGVALMGQFDYDAAHDVFASLLAEHPQWTDVQIDLGIAKLNRRQEDDAAQAEQLLDEVIQQHPDRQRAKYCRAILLLYNGDSARALELFRAVAAADPADAYAIYYTGQCLFDDRQYELALEHFLQAQAVDSYLTSAYYGAFQTLQRLGKREEAQQQLEMFQRLADNPQARSAEIKYSRMGTKADVMPVDFQPTEVIARPAGPLFSDPKPIEVSGDATPTWRRFDRLDDAPAITVCDIDSDGELDLFVASGLTKEETNVNAVLLRRGTAWEIAADHPLAEIDNVRTALWGDFDNDGFVDVYLCRTGPNQLWRQTAANQWENITATSGTENGEFDTVDGAMFDADHDGDLDLFLVNRDGENELLNNNLDGTFRPLAAEYGLQGNGQASRGIVVADLDRDRDADILVVNEQPPHEVYLNDRLWNYSEGTGFERLLSSEIQSAVAADIDSDGQSEIVSASGNSQVLWQRSASGDWQAASSSESDSVAAADRDETGLTSPIAVQDFDGDGDVELMAARNDGWAVNRVAADAAELSRNSREFCGEMASSPQRPRAGRTPSRTGLVCRRGIIRRPTAGVVAWPWPVPFRRGGFYGQRKQSRSDAVQCLGDWHSRCRSPR